MGAGDSAMAPIRRWHEGVGKTIRCNVGRYRIKNQGFALSTLLHQDPRFFQSQKTALLRRIWYAGTRVAVGRSDDGHATFNSPEFLGTMFTSSLQNAYYPRHYRTLNETLERFGGALSSDVISNLLREFTPDLKRLFRKYTPTKVKKIERKLPIPAEDKP
jgi:hypothetical protein